MNKDSQGRKHQITINNPEEHGYTPEIIKEKLKMLVLVYACFAYETGENGTRHVHIYVVTNSPVKFSWLKKLFPHAHIEKAYGKHSENRDYITKEGIWEDPVRKIGRIDDTFIEIGTLPPDPPSAVDRKARLLEMIQEGMSNAEIISKDPSYIHQSKTMNEVRQTLIAEKYAEKDRDIEVIYVHGATGTGKTRDIMKEHGPRNVCRITTYRSGGLVYFDSYNGEDVLVFEEFESQPPITDMLNWLDRYPIKLPARYMDRQACFTKVYITSNLDLWNQYKEDQIKRPEVWKAFLRRISKVKEYKSDGSIEEFEVFDLSKTRKEK